MKKTRRDRARFAMLAWGPDIHMATMLYSSFSNMATMSKELAQFRNLWRMWLVHSESGKFNHVVNLYASSQFLQQVKRFEYLPPALATQSQLMIRVSLASKPRGAAVGFVGWHPFALIFSLWRPDFWLLLSGCPGCFWLQWWRGALEGYDEHIQTGANSVAIGEGTRGHQRDEGSSVELTVALWGIARWSQREQYFRQTDGEGK